MNAPKTIKPPRPAPVVLHSVVSLRQIAEWHDAQAGYWLMTRRQAWGRSKSMRDAHRENEQMHRRFARTIRKQANAAHKPSNSQPPGDSALASVNGSVDWVDCTKEQPPEFEPVLMWYRGNDRIAAWAVVDKLHNRVLRQPDFWSIINPPNDRGERPERMTPGAHEKGKP